MGRINHPTEKLSVGETIQVKIIDYDPETVRVSLGLKQFASEHGKGEDKYPINSAVKGKVVNMMKYEFAFVELEEGVEGLVHVSGNVMDKAYKTSTDLFKIGDS